VASGGVDLTLPHVLSSDSDALAITRLFRADGSYDEEAAEALARRRIKVDPLLAADLEVFNARTFSFKIDKAWVESLKFSANELRIPLTEEYQFVNDSFTPNLEYVELRQATRVREYQELALQTMLYHKK